MWLGGNSASLFNYSSHCLITALFIQLKSSGLDLEFRTEIDRMSFGWVQGEGGRK